MRSARSSSAPRRPRDDFVLAGAVGGTFHREDFFIVTTLSRSSTGRFARNRGRRWRGWGGAVAAAALACAGCQTKPPARDYEPVIARFLLEAPAQDPSAEVVELPRSGVKVPVRPQIVFSEGDIANVELVRVDLGLCLLFEFTPGAARSLLRLTGSNLGRRLVVTLNGRAFGARPIESVIRDGRLLIFVELPDDELTATAVNLKRSAQEIQGAVARGRSR